MIIFIENEKEKKLSHSKVGLRVIFGDD